MTTKANTKEALEQLAGEAQNILTPLGYEVVALEQSTAGGRIFTLFIDFLNNADQSRRVGLEDCVAANRAVDDLFEATELLSGNYTLEVSSPGVERPLRKPEDYDRFAGKKVKLHTFRPLDKEETENPRYWETHKKQKNFIGRLDGLAVDKVKLTIDGEAVKVPLALISKAHLEIEFTIKE
ncbi:MAG: ribosome maturation factor RimP [Deltaproteobacteria bacterium]|nr:ribosome maturation factor RimP [Deltaproteobacteria bacterium]